MKHYALSEYIDEEKWKYLLKLKINLADAVEFNVLFTKEKLRPELEALSVDLIFEGKRADKIYPNRAVKRYRLTENVKAFILAKSYNSWNIYQFEDLSLLKGETEILAAITHEDYVFLLTSEEERLELNKEGYKFGELFEFKKMKP